MKPMRTAEQQIEQLEYIGDMVRQLARMASEDGQNLLTYILNTAAFEIEDQKRLKRSMIISNDRKDDTASATLNPARQFQF